jgi:spore photoproduct lyase
MNVNETENKGKFIKPCPGTPRYICCGYKIIDFARGCSLGCSYCILNHYSSSRSLTIYKNTDKLLFEVEQFLKDRSGITRFGTGEFTDSLLSERAVGLYNELIPMFSRSRNAVLELKTKTANINGILKIKEKDKTIVSWSLNSRYIAGRHEKRAPGVEERIDAASRAQEAGFKLAFHFDPIIIHDSWEEAYKRSIEQLFKKILPGNVIYISMGTLRILPEMKDIFYKISRGLKEWEFIKGGDNKIRYFRPLRTSVYRQIKSFLQQYVSEDTLYMCMENSTVWEDVFNIKNMTSEKLKERLDKACLDKFDLTPQY